MNSINEITNTQVDNVKNLYVARPMYKLMKYRGNYSKTCGILWQYFRDEPDEADNAAIAESESFKYKVK